jgi:hypothetical protein
LAYLGLNLVDSKAEKWVFFSDKSNSSRNLEGSDPMSVSKDFPDMKFIIYWQKYIPKKKINGQNQG